MTSESAKLDHQVTQFSHFKLAREIHNLSLFHPKLRPQTRAPSHLSCQRMQRRRVPLPKPMVDDVLLLIQRQLERRVDILSMMQVSPILYEGGVSLILAYPIRLSSPYQLESFCMFMLDKSPYKVKQPQSHLRFPHLKQLAILVTRWPIQQFPGTIWMTLDVLQHATCLERLEMVDCDEWLGIAPRLPKIISLSTRLKSLQLSGAGKRTLQMLSRTSEYAIEFLSLSFPQSHTAHQDEVVSALETLNPTLKQLRFGNFTLGAVMTTQYLNVTQLTVEDVETLQLVFLRQAFPNLVDLGYFSPYGSMKSIADDVISDIYQSNLVADQFHRLRHIRGDCIGLYLLAMHQNVACVDVPRLTLLHMTELLLVLFTVHPSRLTIGLLVDGDWKHILKAAKMGFSYPESPQLSHLTITIDFLSQLGVDPTPMLSYLMRFIKSVQVPLRFLKVRFIYSETRALKSHTNSKLKPTLAPQKDVLRRYFRDVDLDKFAENFIKKACVVDYFLVEITIRESSAWEVIKVEEEGVQVSKLFRLDFELVNELMNKD